MSWKCQTRLHACLFELKQQVQILTHLQMSYWHVADRIRMLATQMFLKSTDVAALITITNFKDDFHELVCQYARHVWCIWDNNTRPVQRMYKRGDDWCRLNIENHLTSVLFYHLFRFHFNKNRFSLPDMLGLFFLSRIKENCTHSCTRKL